MSMHRLNHAPNSFLTFCSYILLTYQSRCLPVHPHFSFDAGTPWLHHIWDVKKTEVVILRPQQREGANNTKSEAFLCWRFGLMILLFSFARSVTVAAFKKTVSAIFCREGSGCYALPAATRAAFLAFGAFAFNFRHVTHQGSIIQDAWMMRKPQSGRLRSGPRTSHEKNIHNSEWRRSAQGGNCKTCFPQGLGIQAALV